MITRTVKLPETLVEKIDKCIEKGEFSTRADFVLHAMRVTFALYGFKKKEMYDEADGKFKITDQQVNDLFARLSDTYLKGLGEYAGNQVQINTRIPEGLDRKIAILIKPEYGLKNKTEFTRASVICLFSLSEQVEMVFQDAEKMAAEQKRLMAKINQIVIEGLSEGKSTKEILDMAYDRLKESELDSQRES